MAIIKYLPAKMYKPTLQRHDRVFRNQYLGFKNPLLLVVIYNFNCTSLLGNLLILLSLMITSKEKGSIFLCLRVGLDFDGLAIAVGMAGSGECRGDGLRVTASVFTYFLRIVPSF